MKTIIFALMAMFVVSCTPGESKLRLSGNEENLPPELKGLKVYSVQIDGGNYVKVAVLNNDVNSLTYRSGKTTKTTIMINKNTSEVIEITDIISENDSIIVCKKAK